MNLAHILDDHDADSIALIDRGRETTYGELRNQVARLRGGLTELGVKAGDRVVLMCGNSRQFVNMYFAIVGVDAIAVPLNPLSPAPELEAEIAAIDASVVVIEKLSAATWNNVDRSHVPTVRTVIAAEHDDAMPADAVAIDDLLTAEPAPIAEVDGNDTATLIFTSGTAGKPRAAMLTHNNLTAAYEQLPSGAENRAHPGDVIYGVLPLFHIFGLGIVMTLGLQAGATVVLVQRFDAYSAAESVVDRGVTILPGAPAMWSAFAQLEELPADTFSTVRIPLSGAARLPTSVWNTIRDRFGVEIAEGYGLTETAATVSTALGRTIKPGSVGRALDGVEIRLVQGGHDALVGDVGEIWVRGANVFPGYYRDPEATAAVLTDDGWLQTGDMATADDDGDMFIVDRVKDLVIVSGFNVFPAEVEEVLSTHPDVAEVGVVGVPHPHTGEAVKAWVVPKELGAVDEDSLIEHARERLARYKCPSKITFVDQLPRNASGKLVRRRLDDDLSVS